MSRMPGSSIYEAPRAYSARVSHGSALTSETLPEAPVPPRRQARADTLLRVIDGRVSVTLGEDDQVLDAGDEVILPAGTGHRLSSVRGSARVVMGFRPVPR